MSESPVAEDFEKNVFINCPFDDQYLVLLHPLLFALVYLDFAPRIALERSDSGEQRIDKICQLIEISKYSIHDLSRFQSVKKKEYFRLNMPFELGIDYGIRRFGSDRFNEKKFLILSKVRFDYAKAISDLSGVDIRSHEDQPIKIVRSVRSWLKQYLAGDVAAAQVIWDQFNYFMEDFYKKRREEGFSKEDIYEITSAQIGEFIEYISAWIRKKRHPLGPGLGPIASIIGGSYYYTSSTLPDESVKDYNFTIKSGQISRNTAGKLVGEMVIRSPSLSVQKMIEQSGSDRETFVSEDSELSTDPDHPTVFKARSPLIYRRGQTDILFQIDTTLKGYLKDSHFKGIFDANWITFPPDQSIHGSGEFDVFLK